MRIKIGIKDSGRILRAASFLALLGIALMVWSLLEPTPMPVMVAMTIGQGLGTLSLVAFLTVVVVDILHAAKIRNALVRPPGSTDPPDPARQ